MSLLNRRVVRSLALAATTTIALGGCASLNYEDSQADASAPAAPLSEEPVSQAAGADPVPLPETTEAQSEAAEPGPQAASPSAAPTAAGAAGAAGAATNAVPLAENNKTPLRWSDLTRLAREHQQLGEYDEASQRLEQASILVSSLPAAHARRRTVFGLRARLAMQFEDRGEFDRADALADTLIAEADTHPEIGRDALVGLALAQADRRYAKVDAQDLPERAAQRLHVLGVALRTAAEGSANRARMTLADRVIVEARLQNDLELARRAADLAISDSQKIASSQRIDLGWLLLQRAEIAAAQGDYDVAEADAIRANQILEKADSDASALAIAEGTLAGVLGRAQKTERAEEILLAANARDGLEAPLHQTARRVLLGARARIDSALGKRALARDAYRRAIDLPQVASIPDALVRAALQVELEDLSETLDP